MSEKKHAAVTGETHPLARRIGKGVAFGVWVMFTLAAMGMSYVVGVERWESYVKAGILANEFARYVAFAVLVLVYIGADAWVGVSGIIIKAARRWQQPEEADRGGFWTRTVSFWSAGPWIWLARICFVLALALSSTNKIAFLGSMGQAQVVAAIDAQSGADRNLINTFASVRESAIIEAERDGVAGELQIQKEKVAGLEKREGRYTWAAARARDEQTAIQRRLTPLETELKTAQSVEAARARLEAAAAKDAKTTRAELDALAEKVADPRDAWLARVLNIKVWIIAMAVIGVVAFLHELGCSSLLGLATMRPPAWAIEEETAFIVVAKTAAAERRAKIDIAKAEQRATLARSRAEIDARLAMMPEIAAAAAMAERAKTLAEIAKLRKEALGDDAGDDVTIADTLGGDHRGKGWERFARDTVFGRWPRWFNGVRKNGDDYQVKPNGGLAPPAGARPRGFDNIRQPVIDAEFDDAAVQANIRRMREEVAAAAKPNGKPMAPPRPQADPEHETAEERAERLARAEVVGVPDMPRGTGPREKEKVE